MGCVWSASAQHEQKRGEKLKKGYALGNCLHIDCGYISSFEMIQLWSAAMVEPIDEANVLKYCFNKEGERKRPFGFGSSATSILFTQVDVLLFFWCINATRTCAHRHCFNVSGIILIKRAISGEVFHDPLNGICPEMSLMVFDFGTYSSSTLLKSLYIFGLIVHFHVT